MTYLCLYCRNLSPDIFSLYDICWILSRRRVLHFKQELHTIPENLNSPLYYCHGDTVQQNLCENCYIYYCSVDTVPRILCENCYIYYCPVDTVQQILCENCIIFPLTSKSRHPWENNNIYFISMAYFSLNQLE
jgi:hypothetical protein